MGSAQSIQTVLVVDDDETLLAQFARAFSRAGKRVFAASTVVAARRLAKDHRPDLAVIDLRIGNDWGIDLIAELKAEAPELEVALVSGFVGVRGTVEAMHAGANHVFSKPIAGGALLRQIEGTEPGPDAKLEARPTLAGVEWEHIVTVLADCGGNVSETARRLGIHRQALQKRLRTRRKPPK